MCRCAFRRGLGPRQFRGLANCDRANGMQPGRQPPRDRAGRRAGGAKRGRAVTWIRRRGESHSDFRLRPSASNPKSSRGHRSSRAAEREPPIPRGARENDFRPAASRSPDAKMDTAAKLHFGADGKSALHSRQGLGDDRHPDRFLVRLGPNRAWWLSLYRGARSGVTRRAAPIRTQSGQ